MKLTHTMTVLLLGLIVAGGVAVAAGDDWYAFRPTNEAGPSVIGMEDWIERPAGKHGRVTREGRTLIYDGQPIKLWGLNLCYLACAPDKDMAEKRAGFYPKFGINTVRFHKWADSPTMGVQSADSAAEFDPEKLDRLDYQVAKLKEAGIYIELSQSFGTVKMGQGDKRDVPYLQEFGEFGGKKNNRIGGGNSTFYYSPEIQNLQIRQIVSLLRHKNPYTGLTYAEDPAIFAIEIINESSILFFTSMTPLKQSPTIRKMTAERFSDWLKKKYGNQAGLVKAWGQQALDSFERDGFPAVGESIDQRNILPLGNPWYWDPENLGGSQAFRKQRLLDTLHFLYELQCAAYDRWIAAVHQAGYQGEIVASNWQAGRAYSHYANLHTDYRVGLIDRHNYFGGPRRGDKSGAFRNGSLLARAGAGTLSASMQQVEDRPFMLSEWIHVFPNEWGAEGPAIIGAYGFGLQGWDVSYMFQNGDSAAFSSQLGRSPWDVMAPQIVGVFPAVARQVLRGDVQEAAVVAARNVHVPSLFEARLGFSDKVVQGYDDKELDSDKVPARALAVARCVVRFTEQYAETPVFDLRPYKKDDCLVSSTGELRWKEGRSKTDGFFTMDTPGTKAVVGFASGRRCELGDVTITPESPFAALYVTAQGKNESTAGAKRLIVVAMARARNTGMQLNEAGETLVAKGSAPVLMEPVKASIAIRRPGAARVILLDHDGRHTQTTLPVRSGTFAIDGARDRTPYYLIEWD